VAHVRQEIEPEKVKRYGLESADGVIAIPGKSSRP
jgi:hypothetical protein